MMYTVHCTVKMIYVVKHSIQITTKYFREVTKQYKNIVLTSVLSSNSYFCNKQLRHAGLMAFTAFTASLRETENAVSQMESISFNKCAHKTTQTKPFTVFSVCPIGQGLSLHPENCRLGRVWVRCPTRDRAQTKLETQESPFLLSDKGRQS